MFKCPICGEVMRWSELLEEDGDFFDGYVIETSLYHCENCNKDFEVKIDAPVVVKDIEVDIKEVE